MNLNLFKSLIVHRRCEVRAISRSSRPLFNMPGCCWAAASIEISWQLLIRVLAQELHILVLTFASLRGQRLEENAVFCGVAQSCVDAMDEHLAIERTLFFVRSFVVSLRNRNISKTFRCRLVLNSAPTASSSKRVAPGRRTSACQKA